jgi:hypothetical protein
VSALLSTAGQLRGERARAAYDRAADGLLRLIIHVGDGSNLTLDPELDTYYLMVQFSSGPLL